MQYSECMASIPDWLSKMNFYQYEYDRFLWDVHTLIEGTLEASVRYLDAEATARQTKLEQWMGRPITDEHYEYLADERLGVLAENDDQERFLRNMALVALASRLTHTLNSMARHAEIFSPRNKEGYGNPKMSEFEQLWIEYTDRFNIDFKVNKDRLKFVETMRQVRNRIVHCGAKANAFKPLDESDTNSGEAGYVNTRFSKKYSQYVDGQGIGAEVNVRKEQLDWHIQSSVNLVGWLAGELWKKQVASARHPPNGNHVM